jgi:hypothetical protein
MEYRANLGKPSTGGIAMRLTFLGKETQGGGSPTLYATDRDSYLVQGWIVPDEPRCIVEIPESLLRHLPPGSALAAQLVRTGRQWRGDDGPWDTYTVAGEPVIDQETLAEISIPAHESCVEVGRAVQESQ